MSTESWSITSPCSAGSGVSPLSRSTRPARAGTRWGDRWFADETYVKVSGVWRYVYRAVDQYGQVIDVFASCHRDIASARRSFTTALAAHGAPA